MVNNNLTTQEKEFSQCYFSLKALFDQTAYSVWRRGFQKMFRYDDDKLDLFESFEAKVVNRFQSYRVPTIELLRDTPKEAVCQVFEKVIMDGVTLTVFELVTAMFAANNYNLRLDGDKRKERIQELIRDRASNLLDLIEAAMGKRISGRDSEEVIHEYGDSLT